MLNATPPKVTSMDKRPRHYAAEICALATPSERRAALQKVPEEWREITRKHVVNTFSLRKGRIKQ